MAYHLVTGSEHASMRSHSFCITTSLLLVRDRYPYSPITQAIDWGRYRVVRRGEREGGSGGEEEG
jgi:hypothetical protein